MTPLAGALAALIAGLAVLGGYAALSLALLFLVELPTDGESPVLKDVVVPLAEDLVFVVTLPFVVAVVILPATWPIAEIVDR